MWAFFTPIESSLRGYIARERLCLQITLKTALNKRNNITPRCKNMKPCMGCLEENISLIGQPERPSFRRQGINRDKPINASNG